MKFSLLKEKLNKGLSIQEIVNTDLNVIGHNDDHNNLDDVTVNTTTDNFVDATRQQMGRDRTNALYSLDLMNTNLLEDESSVDDNLLKQFPIIDKNISVLVDSLNRSDITPEVYSVILLKLISSFDKNKLTPEFKQQAKNLFI